jgi:tRNA(adenine34) deaminase
MGIAIEEALKAYNVSEVPVGAVLVAENGEVLARAHNLPISTVDPTAHAEILAIRAASQRIGNYRLPQTQLYVTLEPCAMCVGAMLQARVRRLVFGAPDPKAGAAGSAVDLTKVEGFNHYIEVCGGVRTGECSELLRMFFRERRAACPSEAARFG